MKERTKTAVALFLTIILVFLITTPITSIAENTNSNNYNGSTGKPVSKNSVLYDFEHITGTENADKDNYIPSFSLPSYDKIKLTTDNETVFSVSKNLHNQKIPLFVQLTAAVSDVIVSAEIVSSKDGAPVRFGDKSLRISFDFSACNTDSTGTIILRSTAPTFSFKGSPVAIGCWVYIPENTSKYNFYLGCDGKTDSNPVASYQCVTSALDTDRNGWTYLEFDLTKESDFQTSFNTGSDYAPFGLSQGCAIFRIPYNTAEMSESKSDTIYIDDINLVYDYGDTDTEKPTINYIGNESEQIVDHQTVYTSDTNTFIAKYSDVNNEFTTDIDYTSVKMYIDGIDVTDKCSVDTHNDTVKLLNCNLDDGLHSISIEVSDMAGNKEVQIRYFTINTTPPEPETTKPPVSTTAQTTVKNTENHTVTTTEKQTKPTTEKSTSSMATSATVTTTKKPSVSTTKAPIVSTTKAPIVSTTKKVTASTTEKVTVPKTEASIAEEMTTAATQASTTVAITEVSTTSTTIKPMASIPANPLTSVPDNTNQTETITQNHIPGDINGDNRISASDARLTLRIAARLDIVTDNSVLTAADMNNDGRITAADARIILRKAARLE